MHSLLQTSGNQIFILDTACFEHDYMCLNHITNLHADILITLDLAGFHIRTQAGEIALNMLPTKNLNLIWGNKPEYAAFLNKKLCLSMLFYDATGINYQLDQIYSNLLYYKSFYAIKPIVSTEADVNNNRKHFHEMWIDFLNDTLL
jgi:hypothetical protein